VNGVSALVLWDVDHTLVENAGVSKEIYARAFQLLAGRDSSHPVRTDGRTDRLIMRDLFERHGLTVPDWPASESALIAAGRDCAGAMRARGSILPGVSETLKALGAVPGIFQSLLTGNIEANARMKLEAVGLEAPIDYAAGAYGADAGDRASLVAIAQARATDVYGWPFGGRNTILVGDTPRDIDAAARGGAQVIAVASGVDSVEALRAAGATLVLRDLMGTEDFVAAVQRLTS
jgi:phosphoglycolate phosphatase